MDRRHFAVDVRLGGTGAAGGTIRSPLLRRGLAERVRDPLDGRRNVLKATGEGARLHRRPVTRTARMNRVFLAPLDQDERETLLGLIARVTDAAEDLRR
ncbi:MarR family winged helix-turn-helix transcriptional regulator [Streptomyces sp. NPDC047108]|uniref:MarR family winged helix-turn-helix transcriptional regulator n=1 Tax=Streptomyces sp. NPDC047108 TaxID=3155025 RepID=UPI0033F51317